MGGARYIYENGYKSEAQLSPLGHNYLTSATIFLIVNQRNLKGGGSRIRYFHPESLAEKGVCIMHGFVQHYRVCEKQEKVWHLDFFFLAPPRTKIVMLIVGSLASHPRLLLEAFAPIGLLAQVAHK